MEPREEEAWAATLQWRTNDQDLRQVIRAIIARLDSVFREEYGGQRRLKVTGDDYQFSGGLG